MDKTEKNQRKKIITSVITIMLCTTLFMGCTEDKKYTAALNLIEPELSDFGITLEINNYTYEIDYQETEETSPIYDMTIPEYIFIRYIGEKKSVNFFAFKLDSINNAIELFESYKDTYLLHAIELENNESFGDQTFTSKTSFAGLDGYGLEFRYSNVLVVLVGLSVDLEIFNNVGRVIENNIRTHLE